MVGLEVCVCLSSHLRTRRMITVKYLVRRFLGVQQLLDNQELDNIYWLPGTENPADGMSKMEGNMSPMLTHSSLEVRAFLRPLKEACSTELAREVPDDGSFRLGIIIFFSACSKFLFLEFPPLRLTSCLVLFSVPVHVVCLSIVAI